MYSRSRLSGHQSRKFIERRQWRAVIVCALLIVVIWTWSYSLSGISRLDFMNIQSIQVIGADPDIAGNIQAAALDSLEGNYLGIFSKSNALLYPRETIETNVRKVFPRVESVTISREGLQTLAVTVKEKDPSAIVCASLPDFSSDQTASEADPCYFADETGLIFKTAPAFSGQIYNHYFIPGLVFNASSTLAGVYATSTAEFTALQSFYQGIRALGIDPAGILMKDGGEYELYAHTPSAAKNDGSDMMVIYFNNARPFSEELINLVSFWRKMKGDYINIDLRYGSNVFYRKN